MRSRRQTREGDKEKETREGDEGEGRKQRTHEPR